VRQGFSTPPPRESCSTVYAISGYVYSVPLIYLSILPAFPLVLGNNLSEGEVGSLISMFMLCFWLCVFYTYEQPASPLV